MLIVRAARPWRRAVGATVTAGLLVATGSAAAQTSPSTVVITGEARCVDGQQVITWTATKTVTQLSFAVAIDSATMAGATSGPATFDPSSLPRLGADTTTATVAVPGDATGTVTLAVGGTVTVFESTPQPFAADGSVDLPGGCVASTTTMDPTTTAPATTTPATSAPPAAAAATGVVAAPRLTG